MSKLLEIINERAGHVFRTNVQQLAPDQKLYPCTIVDYKHCKELKRADIKYCRGCPYRSNYGR